MRKLLLLSLFMTGILLSGSLHASEKNREKTMTMQVSWNTLVKYGRNYIFAPRYYKKQSQYTVYAYSINDLRPIYKKLSSGSDAIVQVKIVKERRTRRMSRRVRKNFEERRPLFSIKYLKITKVLRFHDRGPGKVKRENNSRKNSFTGDRKIIKYLVIYPRAVSVKDDLVYYEPTKHCRKESYVSYRFKYDEFAAKAVNPDLKKQVTLEVRIDSVKEEREIPRGKGQKYPAGGYRVVVKNCSIVKKQPERRKKAGL